MTSKHFLLFVRDFVCWCRCSNGNDICVYCQSVRIKLVRITTILYDYHDCDMGGGRGVTLPLLLVVDTHRKRQREIFAVTTKATPNQLIVSHPIQFPAASKVCFLNFSDPSILSKNTHYVIRCLHVVEVWQVKKSSTRIWSRSRLQCSYKINLFLSSYLPVITLECVHCTWQSAKIVFWLVFEYLKVITYLINHNFRYRPPAYLTSSGWDEKVYIDLEWPKFHYQANGIKKTPQRAIKKTYAWSGELQKHCERLR